MPAVIAKIIYALAGMALAFSLVGLHRASNDISRNTLTLPGGVPAVLWEPSPPLQFGQTPTFDPPAPVVILCHGFSGDTAMTSALARRIDKAGYAVIAIDFRGHGENRNPFEVSGDGVQLRQDIDAALLYARSQPRSLRHSPRNWVIAWWKSSSGLCTGPITQWSILPMVIASKVGRPVSHSPIPLVCRTATGTSSCRASERPSAAAGFPR
jgi:hypothetical protein